MTNKLLLLSGNDLPFIGGQINIHQPKLSQVAFLGQDLFYLGCNLLTFSKENLEEKDKVNLKNQTNFDILMSIINNKSDKNIIFQTVALKAVLSLLFPQHELMIMPTMLVLTKQVDENHKQQCLIKNDNYEQFKSIVKEMFCLKKTSAAEYNPANKLAAQIAEKFKQRHKKLSKRNTGSINILSRYISILTLGNNHTIPQLFGYTVYQLFDEFERFEKKYSYDMFIKAKLAGAEKIKDVDNWMMDEEDKVPQIKKSKLNRQIEFNG